MNRPFPRAYWVLWAGALFNRLGSFVYFFLALYLTEARHFSVARAGFVVSLYGFGAFLAAPCGGYLADRFGRRRTMVASLALGAAAMLQLGLAQAPWHVALSAALLGFLGDLFIPARLAAIADLVASEERTRAYGYSYWGMNLGFAGAAIIAGAVSSAGFLVLFAVDAATSLGFAALIWLRVPETHVPPPLSAAEPPAQASAPLRDGFFAAFLAAQLLTYVVMLQFNATLPLDMRASGISHQQYGWLMALNAIAIGLLQPAAQAVVRRLSRAWVLAVSALLIGVGFGINAFAHSAGVYAVGIILWTAGELGSAPLLSTVAADLAPTSQRARYQGALQATFGLAAFLAPGLGSLLLARGGRELLWSGCFLAGVAAALLHVAMAPAGRRRLAAAMARAA